MADDLVYLAVLFVHVASVLGFFMVHGISIGIVLQLRKERERERIRALLSLSSASVGGIHMFLLLVIATGLALGFIGPWSRFWWFWSSFLLFFGLGIGMHFYGTRYYDRIRSAVGVKPFYKVKENQADPNLTPEQLGALLTSSRPLVLTAVGLLGLMVILWLMMYKPF